MPKINGEKCGKGDHLVEKRPNKIINRVYSRLNGFQLISSAFTKRSLFKRYTIRPYE